MAHLTETDLIHSFQQATMDERRWFELYNNLLNYGNHYNQSLTQPDNPQFQNLLEETIEFKNQVASQWRLFNHVFDSLPFAVLFLDKDYRILQHNKKATPLYYQPEFQQFLTQLSLNSLSTTTDKKHKDFFFDTQSYYSTLWQQGIYQYYLNIVAYPDHSQVQHIVYAYRDKPQLNVAILSTQFGLTESEVRTLQAIIEYNNNKDISQQLAISYDTLRTHLKNIMRKTQTHSQNELIIKLFTGSYWLGEIQAYHHFQQDNNQQLLNDLVNEPFVLLGKNTKAKNIYLTIIIPSFFGVVWDFIEENALQWQQWCESNHNPMVIINTHQIISKTDWKTLELDTICQKLATHLQDFLSKHYKKIHQVSLIGIHTGTAFALTMTAYLPYTVKNIKLVSPILPLPYMRCEHIRHAEYHSAKKAQKIPKKIWFTIMPHVIEAATKDAQIYFQRRLEYQQYEIDKQKVRHWLSHTELGQIFTDYCQLANYKIAFDVLLLHREWHIPDVACPILCFAGTNDIYTNTDSIQTFAKDYPQVKPYIFENATYTLSLQQWQLLLLQ